MSPVRNLPYVEAELAEAQEAARTFRSLVGRMIPYLAHAPECAKEACTCGVVEVAERAAKALETVC